MVCTFFASTGAVVCLRRLFSNTNCYVSSGTFNYSPADCVCMFIYVERFHGFVHGRSGESRRRCPLSATQRRQPNTRYRGTYLLIVICAGHYLSVRQ